MFARITDRLEVDLGMESLLSRENSEESESLSFFPSLSWQERLGGCLACMVLGYILSLGSFFRMKDLLAGHPTSFVIYTTVGNIISLSGSCFLSGPTAQMNKMLHPTRKIATLLYLTSLFSTLIIAFITHFKGQEILLIILLCAQYISVTWYCLSYIPFARQLASRFFGRLISYQELD